MDHQSTDASVERQFIDSCISGSPNMLPRLFGARGVTKNVVTSAMKFFIMYDKYESMKTIYNQYRTLDIDKRTILYCAGMTGGVYEFNKQNNYSSSSIFGIWVRGIQDGTYPPEPKANIRHLRYLVEDLRWPADDALIGACIADNIDIVKYLVGRGVRMQTDQIIQAMKDDFYHVVRAGLLAIDEGVVLFEEANHAENNGMLVYLEMLTASRHTDGMFLFGKALFYFQHHGLILDYEKCYTCTSGKGIGRSCCVEHAALSEDCLLVHLCKDVAALVVAFI